jgi:hypothetical protein
MYLRMDYIDKNTANGGEADLWKFNYVYNKAGASSDNNPSSDKNNNPIGSTDFKNDF